MANINWKGLAIGIGVVAAFVIAWLLIDKENKAEEIDDLKQKIQERDDLDEQIKNKLKHLVETTPDLDPKIEAELKSIAELIAIKQETKALAALAKIIENLLKELYKKETGVKELAKKQGRSKPEFADYLEFAKVKGIITSEDFHLVSVLRIIRNEESHQLDIKKEKINISAAFIAGFAMVMSLYPLVRNLAKSIKAEVLALKDSLGSENLESLIDKKVNKEEQKL
jgi:hypothetical protein